MEKIFESKIPVEEFYNAEKGMKFIKDNMHRYGHVFNEGITYHIKFDEDGKNYIITNAYDTPFEAIANVDFDENFKSKARSELQTDYFTEPLFDTTEEYYNYYNNRVEDLLNVLEKNEAFTKELNAVCEDLYEQMLPESEQRQAEKEKLPDYNDYDDYDDDYGRGR